MKKEHLEILAEWNQVVRFTAARTMQHMQARKRTPKTRRPALSDGRRTMETKAEDSAR